METLYNGDCLDVLKTISTPEDAIIVTDPPFNVGYKYKSYKDNKKEEEYLLWLADIINGRPCVIINYPEMLYKIAMTLGKSPSRVVSWVYNSNTPRQHRDIAFFGVQPIMRQVVQPYKNLNDKRIKERMSRGIMGGGNVRLDEHQPSEECVKDLSNHITSLSNACPSYGKYNRCPS